MKLSSLKRKFLSSCFIAFFAICLFEPAANSREDWPFSFFGMYQGRLYSDHVQRVDVDIKLPSGEIISAFDLKLTFWHLEDALNFYLHNPEDGRNPEVQRDLAIFLEKDVLPVFRKSGYPSPREINIRYRSWKPFTLETRDRPQTDLIVFHYIVSPDRMGLR